MIPAPVQLVLIPVCTFIFCLGLVVSKYFRYYEQPYLSFFMPIVFVFILYGFTVFLVFFFRGLL